jgi:two-component system response regulator
MTKSPERSSQSPFILLVEDNADDERLALLGLKRADDHHDVQVARDGEQAISQIDGCSPDEIALILLDLKLPKLNGLQVLEHLHTTFTDDCPPVVVFTSSDEPIDIARSEGLGATSFVTKPVDYDNYLETMRSIADQWLRDPKE